MRVQVTRFAGAEGQKRRPRPSDGSLRVTEAGLEIERRPEPRATWAGREPEELTQPDRWQSCQVARVYLSTEQRFALAVALLDSIDDEEQRQKGD